jgi:hypothetical protein
MARKRTNGRFTKSTRRRRTKPKTNLTNLAVSALVANSVTQNVAGIGIYDFLFAGSDFSSTLSTGYLSGGANHKEIVTLRELLSGSQRGTGISLSDALMDNLKANWLSLAVGVIGIPIAAKVAMKLIRKPIILPANRMLKSVGLDVKV